MNTTQIEDDQSRMIQSGFWMTPTDKAKLERLAEDDHRPMSNYLRVLINAAYKDRYGTDDVEVIGKAQP